MEPSMGIHKRSVFSSWVFVFIGLGVLSYVAVGGREATILSDHAMQRPFQNRYGRAFATTGYEEKPGSDGSAYGHGGGGGGGGYGGGGIGGVIGGGGGFGYGNDGKGHGPGNGGSGGYGMGSGSGSGGYGKGGGGGGYGHHGKYGPGSMSSGKYRTKKD